MSLHQPVNNARGEGYLGVLGTDFKLTTAVSEALLAAAGRLELVDIQREMLQKARRRLERVDSIADVLRPDGLLVVAELPGDPDALSENN